MDADEINRKEVLKKLNGTTLMVYFVLLNKRSIGVRDLQRNLELSSPSVARYHLEKLTDLHLVENQNGTYLLVKKAEIPALTSWLLLGRYLIPKVIFAAIFFTCLFVCYFIFFYNRWTTDSLFVVLFGASILLYTWVDVIYQFRNRPF